MSEVVDVPDSPERSPDVECPSGEEGASEKALESRKRGLAEEAQEIEEIEDSDGEKEEDSPAAKKPKADDSELEPASEDKEADEEELDCGEEGEVEYLGLLQPGESAVLKDGNVYTNNKTVPRVNRVKIEKEDDDDKKEEEEEQEEEEGAAEEAEEADGAEDAEGAAEEDEE